MVLCGSRGRTIEVAVDCAAPFTGSAHKRNGWDAQILGLAAVSTIALCLVVLL